MARRAVNQQGHPVIGGDVTAVLGQVREQQDRRALVAQGNQNQGSERPTAVAVNGSQAGGYAARNSALAWAAGSSFIGLVILGGPHAAHTQYRHRHRNRLDCREPQCQVECLPLA